MLIQSPSNAARKIPFATVIDFTLANLNESVRLVQEHGLAQVQFCSKKHRGFHAMVYASGMVTFYAHFSLPRGCGRPRRVGRSLIGNLALHTIAQVHAAYLQVRLGAFQGIDPRERPVEELTYAQFHVAHYRVQCESRQKKSITTDLGRYKHWLEPEFGHIPLGRINATLINQQIVKMQSAKLAAATIRNVIGQLSTSLTLGVELGFIAQNPVKNIKLPRVNNRRTEFLRSCSRSFLLRRK